LTTHKRAKEVAQNYPGRITVKKIAIHTPEAAKYGKVDSGHGIGQAGGVTPDLEKMKKVGGELNELIKDDAQNESLIDAKLKEMDAVLQPVKEKAKELGYLMTPVLIINDQVKSMDYVPDKATIQAWVELEMRKND
jgi:hypothetical protein